MWGKLLATVVCIVVGFFMLVSWAGVSSEQVHQYTLSQLAHIVAAKIGTVVAPSPQASPPSTPASDAFAHALSKFLLGKSLSSSASAQYESSLPTNDEIVAVLKENRRGALERMRADDEQNRRQAIPYYQNEIAKLNRYLANPGCCTGWQQARDSAEGELKSLKEQLAIQGTAPYIDVDAELDRFVYSVAQKGNYEGNVIAYVNIRQKGSDVLSQEKITLQLIRNEWVMVDERAVDK